MTAFSAGFFASAFMTTASIWGVISGFNFEGTGGASWMCFIATAIALSAGREPLYDTILYALYGLLLAGTGLFLAGASAHPGGGVHGAAGANAARAALSRRRGRAPWFE